MSTTNNSGTLDNLDRLTSELGSGGIRILDDLDPFYREPLEEVVLAESDLRADRLPAYRESVVAGIGVTVCFPRVYDLGGVEQSRLTASFEWQDDLETGDYATFYNTPNAVVLRNDLFYVSSGAMHVVAEEIRDGVSWFTFREGSGVDAARAEWKAEREALEAKWRDLIASVKPSWAGDFTIDEEEDGSVFVTFESDNMVGEGAFANVCQSGRISPDGSFEVTSAPFLYVDTVANELSAETARKVAGGLLRAADALEAATAAEVSRLMGEIFPEAAEGDAQ